MYYVLIVFILYWQKWQISNKSNKKKTKYLVSRLETLLSKGLAPPFMLALFVVSFRPSYVSCSRKVSVDISSESLKYTPEIIHTCQYYFTLRTLATCRGLESHRILSRSQFHPIFCTHMTVCVHDGRAKQNSFPKERSRKDSKEIKMYIQKNSFSKLCSLKQLSSFYVHVVNQWHNEGDVRQRKERSDIES